MLYVGRLAPEKNLGAAGSRPSTRCARPSPTRGWCSSATGRRAQRWRRALPDAIFAGTRRGEDLAAHYASADVFLFPSLTETFGNVTLEAMASGLPVLAYDYAAAGQLIRSGENGLLARLGDEPHFIRQAVRLATDREHALRMAQQARETVNELGWERIVAQVESVFAATLAGGGTAREPDAASRAVAGAM